MSAALALGAKVSRSATPARRRFILKKKYIWIVDVS
jgi:hypothetical protein